MKEVVLCSIAVVLLFSTANAQKCVSGEPTSQKTIECCNVLVVLIEPTLLSAARGSVTTDNGEPIPYALAEVFSNPKWIKKGLNQPDPDQRRIIGCATNLRGYFSITGLKKGDYELRISAKGTFN